MGSPPKSGREIGDAEFSGGFGLISQKSCADKRAKQD
jgi:hypothetical protein